MPTLTAITLLSEPEWRARQSAHEARVQAWLGPHQARAARGEKHPVHDFLFSYYAFRPAWLRRWHPGPDIALTGDGAQAFLRRPGYRTTGDGVMVDPAAFAPKRRDSLRWMRTLLITMRERPPFFGCFGLHEWAMLYRQTPEEIRHNAWPLRFTPAELARFVESQPVCCTHFDAFRFFTPPARPLNRVQPERGTMTQHEQRGCLHANMDLYKWAFKLAPFTPSVMQSNLLIFHGQRAMLLLSLVLEVIDRGFEPIETVTKHRNIEKRLEKALRLGGLRIKRPGETTLFHSDEFRENLGELFGIGQLERIA